MLTENLVIPSFKEESIRTILKSFILEKKIGMHKQQLKTLSFILTRVGLKTEITNYDN